jgi:hypothetical protein
MRVCTCPGCGKQIEAADDDALFAAGRAHADAEHADQGMSDDQIRQIIADGARDA